ncbi:uncharacterized protein V1518DRAFT_417273 [Limtongia smithiae]|uniref:uncharacterized protein n=1 Tax=Limtongia smithiae TaxID=1125753 RepID=UPI0034CEBC97
MSNIHSDHVSEAALADDIADSPALARVRSFPEIVNDDFHNALVNTRSFEGPVSNEEEYDKVQDTSKTPPSSSSPSPVLEKESSHIPAPPAHPAKHGFFSKHLKAKRYVVIKKLFTSVLIMGTLMLAFFSIYWGAFYKRLSYLDRIELWVINYDNAEDAVLGSAFVSAATEYAAATKSIRVVEHNASEYNDIGRLESMIVGERIWGLFVISSNATTLLRSALEDPTSSVSMEYNASTTVRFMYSQARDQLAMGYVATFVYELAANASTVIATQIFHDVAAGNISSAGLSEIAASAPHVLAAPVAVGFDNLRPFDNPIATATTQVGLIFIVITSFFQFNFFQPVHMLIAQDLKRTHLILYRVFSSWIAYFFLSLFYSLVSLAFQIDFTRAFGRAGFVVFWIFNWLGMMAVGTLLENLALFCIATYPPMLGFGLIFIVISNIASAFYSIPLQNVFYRYGYGYPIKNLADATRTILFDTRNVMGRNAGVLLAWIAFDISVMPLTMMYFNWQMGRRARAAAAAAAAAKAGGGK